MLIVRSSNELQYQNTCIQDESTKDTVCFSLSQQAITINELAERSGRSIAQASKEKNTKSNASVVTYLEVETRFQHYMFAKGYSYITI